MEELEAKAIDSKREMDILDSLQEIRSRNSRIDTAAKGDLDRVLDYVSSRVEVGDPNEAKKLQAFQQQRSKEEQDDEDEVRRVFGRAYLDGVPDIELGGGDDSDTSSGSEPRTPRDGDESSVASGSGAASSSSSKPAAVSAAIKRKLDAVEPTPASLLSASSKSIVDKSFGQMLPPKKKKGNNALANKLGIKLKPK